MQLEVISSMRGLGPHIRTDSTTRAAAHLLRDGTACAAARSARSCQLGKPWPSV